MPRLMKPSLRLPVLLLAVVTIVVLAAGTYLAVRGDSGPGMGKLAYIVDGNLYVKELPDGEPQQLTEEANAVAPEWSATGEWLSYSTTSNGSGSETWIMRANGDDRRQLGSPPFWSPTEDQLITRKQDEFFSFIVTSADGAREQELLPQRSSGPRRIRQQVRDWTPDGERVFYYQHEDSLEVHVVDADGSNDQLLLSSPAAEDEYRLYGWSANGDYFLFAPVPDSSPSSRAIPEPLQILDLANSQIIDTGIAIDGFHLRHQPNGNDLLAIESTVFGSWRGKRVARLNPASGDVTLLTGPDTAATYPSWSPDGSRIAYAGAPAAPDADPATPQEFDGLISGRRLWLMNEDGSGSRQLTADSRYRDEAPQWTPDGEHLLFVRIALEGDGTSASLWLLNLTTGEAEEAIEEVSYSPERQEQYPEGTSFSDSPGFIFDYWR